MPPKCSILVEELAAELAALAAPLVAGAAPPVRVFTEPDSGRCASCQGPVGSHPRRAAPAQVEPAAPVVQYVERAAVGPSIVEFGVGLLPSDAVVPLISRDVPETRCLAEALRVRAEESTGAEAAVRGHWLTVHDETVGSEPLSFDRTVRMASGTAEATRIERLSFSFVDLPVGVSPLAVARFHHRRGAALLAILLHRVHREAARNVGVWRDTMVADSGMRTGAEDVLERVLGSATSASRAVAEVPVFAILPSSFRAQGWWSALWARLCPRDRLAQFWAVAAALLQAVSTSERQSGRYISRSQWVDRFAIGPRKRRLEAAGSAQPAGAPPAADDAAAGASPGARQPSGSGGGGQVSASPSFRRGGGGGAREGGRFGRRGRGGPHRYWSGAGAGSV